MKTKSETTLRIEREMRELAESFFVGVAIPSLVAVDDAQVIEDETYVYGTGLFDTVKGQRYAICEKLLKFSRKKKRVKPFKHHRNYNPSAPDMMRDPVGKPGSQERLDAMRDRMVQWEKEEKSLFDGEAA